MDIIKNYKCIQRDCVEDHSDYIRSYVNHRKHIVTKSYQKIKNRYDKIKSLLHKVTLYHPHIISYALDKHNTNVAYDDMCKEISNIQKGGGFADTIEIIEAVKELILKLRSTSMHDMYGDMDCFLRELLAIETQLKDIRCLDPRSVLNELNTIIGTFNTFDPTKKEYLTSIKNHNFPTVAMYHRSPHLFKRSIEFEKKIKSYIDLIGLGYPQKKFIYALLFSFHKRQIEKKLLILKKLSTTPTDVQLKISDLLSNIRSTSDIKSIMIKQIDQIIKSNAKLYMSDGMEEISNNIHLFEKQIIVEHQKVSDINRHLEKTIETANKLLYSDENYAIQSHLLPKIRDIIMFMEYYNNVHASKILVYDKDEYVTLHNYIKQLMEYDDDNCNKLVDLMRLIDGSISTVTENDPVIRAMMTFTDDYVKKSINDKILNFNDNYDENVSIRVSKFINEYNQIGVEAIKNINIFMAEQYRLLVNYYLTGLTPEPRGIIEYGKRRERTIRNSAIYSELSCKNILSIMEGIYETNPNYAKIRSNLVNELARIKKKYNFDNLLNAVANFRETACNFRLAQKTIVNEMDARLFIYEYNNIVANVDVHILMLLGLPSQIRFIPTKYFYRNCTGLIGNNLFATIGDKKSKIWEKNELLNNLVGCLLEEKIEMPNITYRPDFHKIIEFTNTKFTNTKFANNVVDVTGKIINLSLLVLEYSSAVSKYNELVEQYQMVYNDVYSYTRYLIIIATRQIFKKGHITYNYLDKEHIELYKRILNNIMVDIKNTYNNELHIVHIRKYYFVVVKKIYIFLNKLSKIVTDPNDLMDIQNINDTLENDRNNLLLFNYFRPIFDSYNEIHRNKITSTR